MRLIVFSITYLWLSISAALAAPIEFVFNIADRQLEFNNVITNTGAHQMRIAVDTLAPNLGTGFGDFTNFYAADVFFDSPGLGLANARVVSNTFLYFGNGVVGFSDAVSNFSTIYTVANPGGSSNDNFEFGGTDGNIAGFDLSQIDIPQILLGMTLQELRTGNNILFDTGDRITGGVTLSNRNDSVSVEASVSAVPLPAAFPLFAGGLALMGMLGWRRKRTTA